VPTVGNLITQRECMDAPRKSNAGPVAKKSAPISWQLIHEVSKLPNVARLLIGTFSARLVSKHISLLTIQANQPQVPSPPCVFVDVAVLIASSKKWDPKPLNGISAATWIVLLATST